MEELVPSYIIVALSLGFLGSGHCIGMCGAFPLLAGSGEGLSQMRRIVRLSAYFAGKTMMYALLGASLGFFGHSLSLFIGGLQQILSVLAGSVMVLAGLQNAGVKWFPTPGWGVWSSKFAATLTTRFGSVVRSSGISSRIVLGMINGLIPCGLVYAALAMSMSLASITDGLIFMVAFGVGTIPALLSAMLLWNRLTVNRRNRLAIVAGWLVVTVGVLTIARAFIPMMQATH